MRRLLIVLLLMVPSLCWAPVRAHQQSPETRVLLVLDCTQSMGQRWQSDTKLRVTQQVLTYLLDSLDDVELALRVYGNQLKTPDGTRLEVPFGIDSRQQMQRKLRTLVPGGQGKASTALSKCRGDFPDGGNARNIILLVTDGQQRDKDLCSLAGQMQMSGNILKTFILCIDPDGSAGMDECGGMVTYLRNEEHLAETLMGMFRMTDRKARLTLGLVDENGKPCPDEVPVVLFDHLSHAPMYSTLYTYDPDEEPDTLDVDPLMMYDIAFYTCPPVEVKSILLKAGQHRHVSAEGGQGQLSVTMPDTRVSWAPTGLPVLVRRHGEGETVATLQLGEQATLLTGHYDIEVLTTPPTRIDNVQLFPGIPTDLQIAVPGQLALTKPAEAMAGALFLVENGHRTWVCNLDPSSPTDRLVLMPGDYQVVLPSPDTLTPLTAKFTITSAQQTGVTIE